MQKWEYCAVLGFAKEHAGTKLDPYNPGLWKFTPEGVKVIEVNPNAYGIAQTIANLGIDGWEAVCSFPNPGGQADMAVFGILFKRPVI